MNISIFKTSQLHIVLHESFFNYLFAQTDDDDADNDNYKHTRQATLFLIATTKFHVFMYFIIFHLSQVKTRCMYNVLFTGALHGCKHNNENEANEIVLRKNKIL